ncbi:hypothetical protein M405DRAFT_881021 [Rhizopogon salebrosus TDB-379]|nr:hypothetical protein M405DRAFT_881021 [Rhizopogon salebrosus TDB-379]
MSYFRVIAPLEGVHEAEAVGWVIAISKLLHHGSQIFLFKSRRGEEGAVGQEGSCTVIWDVKNLKGRGLCTSDCQSAIQHPSLILHPDIDTLLQTPMDEDNDPSRLDPHLPQQEMARAATSGSEVWSIMATSDSSITEPELGPLPAATRYIDQRRSVFSTIDFMDFRSNLLPRARPAPLKLHHIVESALTSTSKTILEQANRNTIIFDLLRKFSEIFTLMDEHQRLEDNSSMQALYGRVMDSAHFINVYLEAPDRSNDLIRSHIEVLEYLMLHVRDQVPQHAADGLDPSKSKCCLIGTRKDIVSEIQSWIGSTGAGVPRVTWLSGTAGKGKSAIAHTIADWYKESRGLGACHYFDCTSPTDLRHT